MAEKNDVGANDEQNSKVALLKQINYDVTKSVLESISEGTEAILLTEFNEFLKDSDFLLAAKGNFMSYVSTLAILSLALMEESAENVSKVMNAIGLDFDTEIYKTLPQVYLHNRLVYVYAFYFLVINGKKIDTEGIRKVVEALGVDFDKKTFEESLVAICSTTKCGRITL